MDTEIPLNPICAELEATIAQLQAENARLRTENDEFVRQNAELRREVIRHKNNTEQCRQEAARQLTNLSEERCKSAELSTIANRESKQFKIKMQEMHEVGQKLYSAYAFLRADVKMTDQSYQHLCFQLKKCEEILKKMKTVLERCCEHCEHCEHCKSEPLTNKTECSDIFSYVFDTIHIVDGVDVAVGGAGGAGGAGDAVDVDAGDDSLFESYFSPDSTPGFVYVVNTSPQTKPPKPKEHLKSKVHVATVHATPVQVSHAHTAVRVSHAQTPASKKPCHWGDKCRSKKTCKFAH